MDEMNLPVERRRELAARAAWLWYVRSDTQQMIAQSLGLSRAAVQRLVAFAVTERLVTVRIDHPIVSCMRLATELEQLYGLDAADVVPVSGWRALAHVAAERVDRVLASKVPTIVAVGAGRTVRSVLSEMTIQDRPQHQIIGMLGSIGRDGSANPYDVVVRLADRLGAQRWPMPVPLVADSVAERDLWQAQRLWKILAGLAERAALGVIGIGQIGMTASLVQNGFIDTADMADLIANGAVAEIAGFVYDQDGRLLDHLHNSKVTSLKMPRPHPMMAVAAGPEKAQSIRAIIKGKLVDRLVTDEATARLLCESA